MMKKGIILNLLFLFFALLGRCQNATVVGRITDEQGQVLPFVVVYDSKYPQTPCQSDIDGLYRLNVIAQDSCVLQFSVTGYKKKTITIAVAEGTVKTVNNKMEVNAREIPSAYVISKRDPEAGLTRINPKFIQSIPDVGMSSVETSIKTQAGVTSRNEFSSQYNVRGGNFDENLCYVNDVMIYRPILVRSGQQEGLSFINPDLVQSITFSSGGFEAQYGDRMSSVLDIKYRKPVAFAASASASLIGETVHFEDVSKDGRFTIITGARHKNNSMFLKNLDDQGNYKPTYTDIQTQMTYQLSKKSQLGFMAYASQNNYLFTPKDRTTSFGGTTQALNLNVYFDGNEKNITNSLMAAVWNQWTFNDKTNLKLSLSAFQSVESESYDIYSQYYLNEMTTPTPGVKQDSTQNLAAGSFFKHARNDLTANVIESALILNHDFGISTMTAGLDYELMRINETINTWTFIDSAKYNMPYSDTAINMSQSIYTKIHFQNFEMNAFVQNLWHWQLGDDILSFNAGIRSNYKSSNDQLTFSPRLKLIYKPAWKRNISFHFAFGYYYQPPFFKEMLAVDGSFYPKTKDQESIHYVVGSDYFLKIWERPFKLTTEAYFKDLKRIIPYTIDNVSLQYFPDKNAHGYATGIDMKLNGEFIKGTESWVSLSVMQTKEKVDGSDQGWQRRPTDQLVNLGMFIQDYLPGNNTYKMSLTMYFGTNVPSNPPVNTQLESSKVILSPYRRVDIGFSKQIVAESNTAFKDKYYIKSIWAGIDILNLLDTYNTVSSYWIKDVKGNYYPVPNYLSGRMFSMKLVVKM